MAKKKKAAASGGKPTVPARTGSLVVAARRQALLEEMTPQTRELAKDLQENHFRVVGMTTIEHAFKVGKKLSAALAKPEVYGEQVIEQIADYIGLDVGRNRCYQMARLAEDFEYGEVKKLIMSSEHDGRGLTLEQFYILTEVKSESRRQKLLEKTIAQNLSGRQLRDEIAGTKTGAAAGAKGRGRPAERPKNLAAGFVKLGRLAQQTVNYGAVLSDMTADTNVDELDSAEELEATRQRSTETKEALLGLVEAANEQVVGIDAMNLLISARLEALAAETAGEDENTIDAEATGEVGEDDEFGSGFNAGDEDEFEATAPETPKSIKKKGKKKRRQPAPARHAS
jgi:hypothetical protein